MKALVIAAVLFFSLRAMSNELGQDEKGQCKYSTDTSHRMAKDVSAEDAQTAEPSAPTVISL